MEDRGDRGWLDRAVRITVQLALAQAARGERVAQLRDVPGLEHVRREEAHDLRVAAGAGEDVVLLEQLALHVLRGPARAQPDEETRALRADHRARRCSCSRSCCDSSRTLASRPSLSMMSTTVSITAQAIGPPPKVVPRSSCLQVLRDVVGHQQRRARKARRRAPWPS